MNTIQALSSKLSQDIAFSEERLITEALCAILGQNYPIQSLQGRLEQQVYLNAGKSHKTFLLDKVAFLEIYPLEYDFNDETGIMNTQFGYKVL